MNLRFIAIGVAAALLSWVLVANVRRYALSTAVLDHPTERSSHTRPVPRGGGAGCVAAVLVMLLLEAPTSLTDWRLGLALAGAVTAAVIGWMDDNRSVSIWPRLSAHVVAALLVLPLALQSAPAGQGVAVLWAAGWLLATISAINVINFMDGIDGLIGLQAVVFGAHLALLGGPQSTAGVFGCVLTGAALGFLFWNWSPAKIFLGDVGSGALGVLGVVGGLVALRESIAGFLPVFLPLFPVFLDATVTIVRRIRKGEHVTVAHRTHLYQRLANGGWGHARVSALFGLVAAGGSVVAMTAPAEFLVAACAAYCVAVIAVWWMLERAVLQVRVARGAGS